MAQALRLIALASSLAMGGVTYAAEITESVTGDGVVIAIGVTLKVATTESSIRSRKNIRRGLFISKAAAAISSLE